MLIGADDAIVDGQFADPPMDDVGGAGRRMKERPAGAGGEEGEGEGGVDTGPASNQRGVIVGEATRRRGEAVEAHQREKTAPKRPPRNVWTRPARRTSSEGAAGSGSGSGAGEEARVTVEELQSVSLALA